MQSANVILKNEVGLHARPAALLVQEASKYKSEISIIKNEKSFNARSIISILGMGAFKGDALTITAKGEDEVEAINALKNLIENLSE